MKKKNFIKKIKEKISEFFEEEEPENEEEEINLKTLLIIFLIGFVIIISIYLYTNKGFGFIKSELNEREDMEQDDNREIIQFEDYFRKRKGLENSDFSGGMNHWSTHGKNDTFNISMADISINNRDYHSEPQSLQMFCPKSGCKVYYNKISNSTVIDNPYSIESGIWMGVKQKGQLKLKYWYRGGDHTLTILRLNKYGEVNDLKTLNNEYSEKWTKKEIIVPIKDENSAFGIEVLLGHNCYLLIDDIQAEIV